MATRSGLTFRMRVCPRCGGDAYRESAEEMDWRCLQCGRTVPLDMINRALKLSTRAANAA